jgi:hypothetical protein
MLPTTDPGVQVARRRLLTGVYRVLVIHWVETERVVLPGFAPGFKPYIMFRFI